MFQRGNNNELIPVCYQGRSQGVNTNPEAMGKFSRGAVLLTSCWFAAITGKICRVLSPGSVLNNRHRLKSLLFVQKLMVYRDVFATYLLISVNLCRCILDCDFLNCEHDYEVFFMRFSSGF